jgi:HK97 family phage major capsid protein
MALTIDKLIANKDKARGAKFEEYNDLTDELKTLRAAESYTPEQRARVEEIKVRKGAISGELDAIDAEIADLKRELEDDDKLERMQAKVERSDAALPAGDDRVRVGQEPRTYTRETAASGLSFFRDAFGHAQGDIDARERLERHAREVKVEGEMSARAVASGTFGGLIVPQYLIEMAALKLRAGRGVANIVSRHQLPAQGMNLVIPRGTTGASTDVQASENSGVSATDEVWQDLTVPVRTIAGQADVSRQALERGDGVDELMYLDLTRSYAASLGSQLIGGSGAAGQVLGILNTGGIGAATAFGAAVTTTNLNSKIAGAEAAIWSGGMGLAPDVLVMHPRRWGWLIGQVDANGRPIVVANTNGPQNAFGVGGFGGDALADAPVQFVGIHSSGVPVMVDLNIGTANGTLNEDVILALDSDELHLWEDGDGMPKQLRFEQTTGGSLTTKLVVYNYVAFTAGRYPQAVAKVGGIDTVAGNGLIAPVF